MKKRLIGIALTLIVVLGFSVTSLANSPSVYPWIRPIETSISIELDS